jgi:hypothetical protein
MEAVLCAGAALVALNTIVWSFTMSKGIRFSLRTVVDSGRLLGSSTGRVPISRTRS